MKKILTLFYKDLRELWSSKNLMLTFFLFSTLSWLYFAWSSYEFAMLCAQRGETRITVENYWQYNADASLIRSIISFNFFLLLVFLPYLLLSLLSEEKKQHWLSYFTSYRISWKQYLGAKMILQVFLVLLFTGSSVFIQYLAVQSVVPQPLNLLYFVFTFSMIALFLVLVLSLSVYSFYIFNSLLKGLVLTYMVLIFLWLIHIPFENHSGILPLLFQELSFSYRIEKVVEGLFRFRDAACFLAGILFLNFGAWQSLRKQQL